jgi:hypothetical protein
MKTITIGKKEFDKVIQINGIILQALEDNEYEDDLNALQKDLDRSHNRIVNLTEVETRVYVIDTQEHINDLAYTDEEFMTQAEESEDGRIYTLQGFQEAFNQEEINSAIDVIRFISVPLNR